jgi:hypothetical protein
MTTPKNSRLPQWTPPIHRADEPLDMSAVMWAADGPVEEGDAGGPPMARIDDDHVGERMHSRAPTYLYASSEHAAELPKFSENRHFDCATATL